MENLHNLVGKKVSIIIRDSSITFEKNNRAVCVITTDPLEGVLFIDEINDREYTISDIRSFKVLEDI